MRFRLVPLLILASSCAATPDEGIPVTPQRPTLSSDTATTRHGSFEIEAGGAYDPDGSFDSPVSLKYGSGPSTEVFLNWSPLVHVELPGEDQQGPSDLSLGLRHRFFEETEDAPSMAVQAAVKLPTADDVDGLGTGELDASFAGILTKSFGRYAVTGFYSLGVLGDPSGGTNVAHSGAIATSAPISGRFGGFGELAGISVPDEDRELAFTTLGFTYSPAASLVIDFGVVVGLDDDAPEFQIVLGFTRNLGRPGSR